jgi:hypothetical protein
LIEICGRMVVFSVYSTWHPLSVNFYSLIFSVTTVQISKNSSTLKLLGQMNRHYLTYWQMRDGRKHMENQNKIFKHRIEMPVISAIFFSGNENDQNWHFQKFRKLTNGVQHPKRESSRCVTTLMKNIKVVRGIALTWHPLSVNF